MTQKRYTEIPKRQKCINKEEPYIGGASDIIDDVLGKPQSQINDEVLAEIGADDEPGSIKGRVKSLEDGEANELLKTVQTLTTAEKDQVAENLNNRGTTNGMGRIELKATDNFKTVVEAQTGGNVIFVIKYDFTITNDVTIPANCILVFDGGSISGNNNILRVSENCVLDMGGTLPTGIKIFSDNKTTRIKNPPFIDFYVNDEIFWGRFWNMNWQELTFKMEPIHRPFKLITSIGVPEVSRMIHEVGCLRHCGITECNISFNLEWNASTHTYTIPTVRMEQVLAYKNIYNLEPYYFRIQNDIRNDASLRTSYNIMKSESEIYIPLYISSAKEIVDYIKENFPNTKYIFFDNESTAIYRNENWMNGYKELYSYAESKGFIGGIDDNTSSFYNAAQRSVTYGGGLPDFINNENVPFFGINIYPNAYSTLGKLKYLSSCYNVEDIVKELWEKTIQEHIYYIIEKRGFDNIGITESGFSPSWYSSFNNVDGFDINDNKWDIVCAGQIEALKIWRNILKRYSAVISFWSIQNISLHWYSSYYDDFSKNINKSIYNLFINF